MNWLLTDTTSTISSTGDAQVLQVIDRVTLRTGHKLEFKPAVALQEAEVDAVGRPTSRCLTSVALGLTGLFLVPRREFGRPNRKSVT